MPNAEQLDPSTPFADSGEMVRAIQDPRYRNPIFTEYRRIVEQKISLMPDDGRSTFTDNTRRVSVPITAPEPSLADHEATADATFSRLKMTPTIRDL